MPTADSTICLAPHCSLTTRGALLFFGSVCVATFAVAGVATVLGYWPVLPFAGAEMWLLGWALKVSMARRNERETIQVSENEVVIEYSLPEPERIVFPRHWARVKIARPQSPLHRTRLLIESHGRALEVGRFLTEEERRQLAVRLHSLIGAMSQSPALPRAGSPEQYF